MVDHVKRPRLPFFAQLLLQVRYGHRRTSGAFDDK
jgi:hypothetical protein